MFKIDKVIFRKPFYEFLKQIDDSYRQNIINKIKELISLLESGNYKGIKKLNISNRKLFRIRQGDFRIIFDFFKDGYGGINILDIFNAGKRSDIYRDFLKKNYSKYFNVETSLINLIIDESSIDEKETNEEDIFNFETQPITYFPALWCFKDEIEQNTQDLFPLMDKRIYDLEELTMNYYNTTFKKMSNYAFIIQGPPGTGKSLLIYNFSKLLINNYINNNSLSLILVPTENLKEDFFKKRFDSEKIDTSYIKSGDIINEETTDRFFKDLVNKKIGILTFYEFFTLLDKEHRNLQKIDRENFINVINLKKKGKIHSDSSPFYLYRFYLVYQSSGEIILSEKDYLYKVFKEKYENFCKKNVTQISKHINLTSIDVIKDVIKKEYFFPLEKFIQRYILNIFVDEVQELLKVECETIIKFWKKFANGNSILFFAGDIFQRSKITDFRFEELKNSLIKSEIEYIPDFLKSSFRVPKEAAEYAKKYILKIENEYGAIIRKKDFLKVIEPEECKISYASNFPIAIKATFNELKNALRLVENYDNKKIVVIYNKEKDNDKIEELRNEFKFLETISSDVIKGLEFDNVLVFNIFYDKEGNYNDFEIATELYLSLTRTTGGLIHFVCEEMLEQIQIPEIKFEKYSVNKLAEALTQLKGVVHKEQYLNIIENLLENLDMDFTIKTLDEIFMYCNKYTEKIGYDRNKVDKIADKIKDLTTDNEMDIVEYINENGISGLIPGLILCKKDKIVEGLKMIFLIDKEIGKEIIQSDKYKIDFYDKLKVFIATKNEDLEQYIESEIKNKKINKEIVNSLENLLRIYNNDYDVYITFLNKQYEKSKKQLEALCNLLE